MKRLILLFVCAISSLSGNSVTLNKYRIYCESEASNVYVWREATEADPTTCPNNTAHQVNINSISIVDVEEPNEISIKEEWTPTGGYFKAETFELDINAGPDVTSTFYFSWPMDITLMEFSLYTTDVHEGDTIIIECPFDTIVGALTQDVSIGDTVLHVDTTTLDNISKGFYVQLDDFGTSENLGRVVGINYIDETITLEHAAGNIFSSSDPTYIKISVCPVNFTFGKAAHYRIGESVLRGSPIPANRQCRIQYINRTGSAKKLIIPYEYQY